MPGTKGGHFVIAIVLVLIVLAGTGQSLAEGTKGTEASSAIKVRVEEAYGKLPLHFEANQGQTDTQVNFLSRGSGYTLFLTPIEAVLALKQPSAISHQPSAVKTQDSQPLSPPPSVGTESDLFPPP
ncbi:MAG: hypothetical protein HY347_06315 [candidate division NC10 bacterium]|nr:hypothetical protein [candidate division NC10 bacterium]